MKEIEMKVMSCNEAGWFEDGTKIFNRVSRWIMVRQNDNPCSRNSLWDYVMDARGYKHYQEGFNPENGLWLDYFTFNGRKYALEQFLVLGNPFCTAVSYSYEDENGKQFWLSGVDGEALFNPIYIEMDEYGERVRVYTEA